MPQVITVVVLPLTAWDCPLKPTVVVNSFFHGTSPLISIFWAKETHTCVCVSNPKATHMKWSSCSNQLNKCYNISVLYMAVDINSMDGHSLSNKTCHKPLPKQTNVLSCHFIRGGAPRLMYQQQGRAFRNQGKWVYAYQYVANWKGLSLYQMKRVLILKNKGLLKNLSLLRYPNFLRMTLLYLKLCQSAREKTVVSVALYAYETKWFWFKLS